MSGIYIPGMKMPENCRACEWCVHTIPGDKYICYRMNRAVIGVCETDIETVNACCPLVPVPDHGDLIERDEVIGAVQDIVDNIPIEYMYHTREYNSAVERGLEKAKATMVYAPTIIPEDRT